MPDLFTVTCGEENHRPTFFVSSGSRASFKFEQLLLTSSPMPDLISSYSVDLDSDCLPELLLYRQSRSTNLREIQVWKGREDGELGIISNETLPSILSVTSSPIIGLPTFADIGECREWLATPHTDYL